MKTLWAACGLVFLTFPLPCAAGGVVEQYGVLPLYFIENQGQLDNRASYYVQGRDKSVYFGPDGVTFLLTGAATGDEPFQAVSHTTDPQRWAVRLEFVEPNPDVAPAGHDPTQAVVSYFKGPASQWKTGLRTYAGVVYRNLWPGIDLVYSGTTERLKYEFVVKPGADPGRIRLRYRGAEAVRLNGAGQLEVTTPVGGFSDEKPYAYQEVAGHQTGVAAAFRIGAAYGDTQLFGFEIDEYDPRLPLVIDPAVIVHLAYVGGGEDDKGYGIGVDAAGNAYVTGSTESVEDFPTVAGPVLTANGGMDAFVAKLNASGTALIYAGYLGGDADDWGSSIAVDGAGSAYIAGSTQSAADTFPVAVGPDFSHNGGYDGFVAKIDPSGTAIVFAGYIGGAGQQDGATGIAVDDVGNAYVVGSTNSDEDTFPVSGGPDLTRNGGRDAFVAKVAADGTALTYAGYIGGAVFDVGSGIAVDKAGNAYVVGVTGSAEDTFPVAVGPDLTHNGDLDGFVVKVSADGSSLVYAGFIGGSNRDDAISLAVDDLGNAYIAGRTWSADGTFPVAIGPSLTCGGNIDAFVAKVHSSGAALDYAGCIGGSDEETASGIAIDARGNAYVTGWTMSGPDSFPLAGGPDTSYSGGVEAFVAKVVRDGSGLSYAGYIGGSGDDYGQAIAVDAFGSAYVTGSTNSPAESFSAAPSFGELKGTGDTADVFVAKIATGPVVAGVFNAASWMPAGLPGHGIAQGAMFVLTGRNMGPDPLVFPGTLPLPAVMEETSIEVTVGGVTVSAFMVYTWTNQLAAVLPSTTPTGQGTLTVTYNGETSAPFPILVVPNAFGIFTRNQSGYGPAIVQNWISPVEVRLNSLIDSATGEQYEILWGTGLGAITGDDSALPPVGNLNVNVQVLVSGRPAVVHYKGRSAQFPGIDQIQFQVPAGVEGCYAPLVVIVNGVVSNFGTMAVNSSGGTCSDRVSFLPADLAPTAQGTSARLGGIVLLGIDFSAPGMSDGNGLTGASAEFGSVPPASMLQGLGPVGFLNELLPPSIGACYVYQGVGAGAEIDDRAPRAGLAAGNAMSLNAPFGAVNMPPEDSGFLAEGSEDDNLIVPGLYTFDNGTGGDVGSFQASITVPVTQFTWTNRDAVQAIARAQDLNVTWTGGDDSQEVVVILGYSTRRDLNVVGTFMCAERVSAGQFTLPSWMLSTLPVNTPWDPEGEEDLTSGLIVGRISRLDQNRFAASGLDTGFLYYLLADYRVVPYE